MARWRGRSAKTFSVSPRLKVRSTWFTAIARVFAVAPRLVGSQLAHETIHPDEESGGFESVHVVLVKLASFGCARPVRRRTIIAEDVTDRATHDRICNPSIGPAALPELRREPVHQECLTSARKA